MVFHRQMAIICNEDFEFNDQHQALQSSPMLMQLYFYGI